MGVVSWGRPVWRYRIKVDRAFIRDIDQAAGEVIAETIISLGKRLNLATIAEGVETLAQEQAVMAMGCDEVQGFVFSKPLPAQELQQMLQQQPFLLSSTGARA